MCHFIMPRDSLDRKGDKSRSVYRYMQRTGSPMRQLVVANTSLPLANLPWQSYLII